METRQQVKFFAFIVVQHADWTHSLFFVAVIYLTSIILDCRQLPHQLLKLSKFSWVRCFFFTFWTQCIFTLVSLVNFSLFSSVCPSICWILSVSSLLSPIKNTITALGYCVICRSVHYLICSILLTKWQLNGWAESGVHYHTYGISPVLVLSSRWVLLLLWFWRLRSLSPDFVLVWPCLRPMLLLCCLIIWLLLSLLVLSPLLILLILFSSLNHLSVETQNQPLKCVNFITLVISVVRWCFTLLLTRLVFIFLANLMGKRMVFYFKNGDHGIANRAFYDILVIIKPILHWWLILVYQLMPE